MMSCSIGLACGLWQEQYFNYFVLILSAVSDFHLEPDKKTARALGTRARLWAQPSERSGSSAAPQGLHFSRLMSLCPRTGLAVPGAGRLLIQHFPMLQGKVRTELCS